MYVEILQAWLGATERDRYTNFQAQQVNNKK